MKETKLPLSPERGKLYKTRNNQFVAIIHDVVSDPKIKYPVFGEVINTKTGRSLHKRGITWMINGQEDQAEETGWDIMEYYGDADSHPEYFL